MFESIVQGMGHSGVLYRGISEEQDRASRGQLKAARQLSVSVAACRPRPAPRCHSPAASAGHFGGHRQVAERASLAHALRMGIPNDA